MIDALTGLVLRLLILVGVAVVVAQHIGTILVGLVRGSANAGHRAAARAEP